MGGATPAGAQGLSTAPDRSADAALGEAALREALERDLGISGAELDDYLAAAAEATELDAQLREELGGDFAGSWFDRAAGSLTVAVTDAGAASLATAAGAETALVTRSERELAAIVDELDAQVEADPDALSGVYSWGVDALTNQVVLTVQAGQAGDVASLVAGYEDAVRVEESEQAPQTAQDYPWLDGGIPYNGCSTGFNMRNPSTGARYFLTAGHCGTAGTTATGGNGVTIGTFTASFFPTFDDALVQVTNTAFWLQGPFVFTWPGFVSISNTFTDAPVGTPICKSGRTTGWTCGTITVKDETVNYPQGTVFGLTRHNACVEPGDSGGSNLNVSSAPYRAEGVTSGASLIGGLCLSKFGMANISWYFPAADSIPFYNSVYGVVLW
jgi:streptogrisin C